MKSSLLATLYYYGADWFWRVHSRYSRELIQKQTQTAMWAQVSPSKMQCLS